MESPQSSNAPKMTSSEVTRREVLEVAAVTGGILVAGGHLMPGAVSPAAAQATGPSPAPLEIALRVNGAEHRLTLDPRTTLLDALREHLHLTGLEERLRARPVRRLHGADGRQAREIVPLARSPRRGARDHDHRGPGRKASNCIRCKPPSSSVTPSSAAIARPARSWPASPASTRATPARPQEIRDWMSGNLCRCGAYDHIVAAIQDAARATPSVRGG